MISLMILNLKINLTAVVVSNDILKKFLETNWYEMKYEKVKTSNHEFEKLVCTKY